MRPLPVLCRSALLLFLRGSTIFFLILLATSLVPVLSAQSMPFNGPRDYVVGSYPESVVVGDFNGDGRPDIATANQQSNNISVLVQNSDGSFQAAVNYAVGNGPVSLQVGDVNGDGKLDLVVINLADSTLAVLLGNGNGTFQAEKLTILPVPPTPTGVMAVGDFNGDGKADVAIAEPLPQVGAYAVAVMLSNGDGTFQAAVTYPINGGPSGLAAADFNNDGKLDLASVGSEGGGVSVLLGNGNGTFQAAINTTVNSLTPTPLVVADFNQDGNLDIATATLTDYGATLTLLLGNGDGTFQVQVDGPPAALPLAAGDLNGDGKPDLIATAPTLTIGIVSFLNNGDGTFSPSQFLFVANDQTNITPTPIALSDLNGDGKLDLVAALSGTRLDSPSLPDIVSVLHGDGDGTLATFPSYALTETGASNSSYLGGLVAADFNGDGKVDLAAGMTLVTEGVTYTLQLGLLLNDGAGFSPPAAPTNLGGGQPQSYVAAGDFNGSQTDLALSTGPDSAEISILLGNGNGTFQPVVQYGAGVSGPIAVGDFNGDGKLDVIGVAPDTSPDVSVLLGNGDGTFGFPVNSPASGYVRALAVADFNRDGKLDAAVLAVNTSTQLVILFGNGDGTFSLGQTYNVGFSPTCIASADINGDGIPDLIVGNSDGLDPVHGVSTPSSVVVLIGNGDGTFKSPTTTVAGAGIVSIAVADFNLDGKADVVISNSEWNDVSLLLGNGDGTFQAPMQFYLGTDNIGSYTFPSGALAVADFDGNGSPDVAVASTTSITVLLNGGSGGPAALLSPGALGFGNQAAGQTSPPQTATLSYMASTALTIASVTIVGPQNGDYQQSNTCGTSLAAGANCTITVTFTPQAVGVRTALIQITDNAINSPQTIALTGTGAGLGLSVPSGGSSSATVAAGQTATYTLAIGGVGVSGTASFSCTGAPRGASCSPPATVNVSATSASTFTVTVTTTSRTLAAARSGGRISPGWWAIAMFGFVILPTTARRKCRSLRLLPLVFLFMCSCGGSNSGGSQTNPNGTPAGSYTLTLNANSGATSQSMPLTLNVQ